MTIITKSDYDEYRNGVNNQDLNDAGLIWLALSSEHRSALCDKYGAPGAEYMAIREIMRFYPELFNRIRLNK